MSPNNKRHSFSTTHSKKKTKQKDPSCSPYSLIYFRLGFIFPIISYCLANFFPLDLLLLGQTWIIVLGLHSRVLVDIGARKCFLWEAAGNFHYTCQRQCQLGPRRTRGWPRLSSSAVVVALLGWWIQEEGEKSLCSYSWSEHMQETALKTPRLVNKEQEETLQVYGEAGTNLQPAEDPELEQVDAQSSLWPCGNFMLEHTPGRTCSLMYKGLYSVFGLYFALFHSDLIGYKLNQMPVTIIVEWSLLVYILTHEPIVIICVPCQAE